MFNKELLNDIQEINKSLFKDITSLKEEVKLLNKFKDCFYKKKYRQAKSYAIKNFKLLKTNHQSFGCFGSYTTYSYKDINLTESKSRSFYNKVETEYSLIFKGDDILVKDEEIKNIIKLVFELKHA